MTNAYKTESLSTQTLNRYSLQLEAKRKNDKMDSVLLLLLGLFGLAGFLYVLLAQS